MMPLTLLWAALTNRGESTSPASAKRRDGQERKSSDPNVNKTA